MVVRSVVLWGLAIVILGYTIIGSAREAVARESRHRGYTPTLEVYKDPNRSVYCYKDSWSGISVALSCVYIPPVIIQKGNHDN